MSKISGHSAVSQGVEMPWNAEAGVEVRGLRGAISAQIAQKPVSNDVAPMMSELLARLDSLVEGAPRHHVAAPPLGGLSETPSLRESVAAMGSVGPKVRAFMQSEAGAEPKNKGALDTMLRVLDHHLSMRQEVVMRSQI